MGCARGGLATPTTSPFMDVVQLGHAMKGVFMSVCVPVRSMKNTAEFAELVERERDVTVTKNGCEIFHCLSDEQYRAMRDELEAGAYCDYDDFVAGVREEYGL